MLNELLDYVWKRFYGEKREKHEKINTDKDKDIDGYVSMYTDIINDKLEFVNRIGELLGNNMVEAYNVVGRVRQTNNDSLIYDILAENLKKWKDDVLELINSVNVCAKPNNKKDKPDTKKDKPNTKKDKPDTSKNKLKNRANNKIKYELQDIAKYREVLEKMIFDRIGILELMRTDPAELIENTDTNKSMHKFYRLYICQVVLSDTSSKYICCKCCIKRFT